MSTTTQAPAGEPALPAGPDGPEDPTVRRAWAVADRLHRPMPQDRVLGWVLPLVVTGLGAFLRWFRLDQPASFVFDETYYAKDAFSLLRYGYEQQFVEKANDLILASDGDINGLDQVFKESASYVVHPPLGKWTIALGEWMFGMTPFGWRFMVALLGTLMILVVARAVRRLTRSTLIGTIAGLLVAIDGVAIVLSRTALLDGVLAFFLTCAFAALLLDRDWVRSRWATRLRRDPASWGSSSLGPMTWWRPWLIVAGVCLGAAAAVKWSALWHIAFMGLLVFAWGIGARRLVGATQPWLGAALRDGLPALVPMILLPVVVYLASWWGWFASDDAWLRTWAATNPSTVGWMPDALRSLWHYHAEAWRFHVGLTSDHAYEANAWNWPVMGRPTSFFYESPDCGGQKCAQEVIALGNPIIWWAGALALIHQAWRWIAVRDPRSGVVVSAWLAGWAPWLLFQERTIFTFYAIVLVPFLAAALAMSLGQILGPVDDPVRRPRRAIDVGAFLLLACLATWFFLPIWTGQVITYEDWQLRMWLPTWV